MNNKLLIGGGIFVIVAIVLVSGFLNQATNSPVGIQAERDRQLALQNGGATNSQADQISSNLNNIAKIENQKITEINDKTIKLANGEIITFTDSKNIGCKVGDVISDYNETNQSLVCVRTDPNTGQKSNFFANVGSGIVGGLIGNYIASKLFARNNGLNFDSNINGYRSPNGDVFTQNQQSVQSGTNQRNSGFGRSTVGAGGAFGGIFGGGKTTSGITSGADSNGTSGGTKSGTHVGSGGISGSKGGSGGGVTSGG